MERGDPAGLPGSGVDTSSYHYKSRRRDQAGIEARIRDICATRVRYGYRRVIDAIKQNLPLVLLAGRDLDIDDHIDNVIDHRMLFIGRLKAPVPATGRWPDLVGDARHSLATYRVSWAKAVAMKAATTHRPLLPACASALRMKWTRGLLKKSLAAEFIGLSLIRGSIRDAEEQGAISAGIVHGGVAAAVRIRRSRYCPSGSRSQSVVDAVGGG